MSHKDTIEKCPKCGNEFIKRMIRYPTKAESKRDSYYSCPYCGESWDVHLLGDEEVMTFKKNQLFQ